MTGTDIVGALLLANADLLTLVPAGQIKAGALPEGSPIPAILLRVVSTVEQQPLKRGAVVRTRDRVATTVRAENYSQQKDLIKRIRSICAGQIGDTPGARRWTILTDGTGPDLDGPGGTFERTIDFRVSYDA